MGVSIGYQPIEPKTTWITPGWRSMMHQLLLDNNLYGLLDKNDIPLLLKIGKEQCKGTRDPPFDYAEDIHAAFRTLVRAIRRHGSVVVVHRF